MNMPELIHTLAEIYLTLPTPTTLAAWQAALAGTAHAAAVPLQAALKAIDPRSAHECGILQTEYTRLFVGPASLPCPPWESVYTSPQRRMLQQAHDDMARLCAEAGLVIRSAETLPDHMGAELLFLGALLERLSKENEDKQQKTLRLADRLLDDHLNRWVGPFTGDLEAAATQPFYRALARTTRDLLSALQS